MLWAVLQFALPAAASVADAHVERESRAQLAHVESTSTTSCRPVHPAECALCQLVSRDVARPAGSSALVVATVGTGPIADELLIPASAARGRLPSARAPPSV